MTAPGRTIVDKIWRAHVIRELSEGRTLLHIDRHLVHDASSPDAFKTLSERGLKIRTPELNYAVIDHTASTMPERKLHSTDLGRRRIEQLQQNCRDTGLRLFDLDDPRQGIVHVIAPELGIALPGTTLVCGDSHTATCGGVGALAWGIGTSEVAHALAMQALIQRKPKTLRVSVDGRLSASVTPKDLILLIIRKLGVAAGRGFAIEYAGPAVRALPIEGRLTLCNMSIEMGSRIGLVAPDDVTFEYLAGREMAPKGAMWDEAVAHWRTLPSDDDAPFDRDLTIDCNDLKPQVSWGTSPQDVIGIDEPIPDPADAPDAERRAMIEQSLSYMDLRPGRPLEGVPINVAFIGSCTNGRLSDLRSAAEVVRGRKVAPGVRALIVPGSAQVKAAAEQAGIDQLFKAAGFEWRESGCSMCNGTNGDIVPPGMRSISTTNRNFESRQGPRSRTHLASPAMVAAAAVSGCIADARKLFH